MVGTIVVWGLLLAAGYWMTTVERPNAGTASWGVRAIIGLEFLACTLALLSRTADALGADRVYRWTSTAFGMLWLVAAFVGVVGCATGLALLIPKQDRSVGRWLLACCVFSLYALFVLAPTA